MAALVTRDDIETGCQQVDDLSLAFVSPLSPEHSEIHIQAYDSTLKRRGRPRRACHALRQPWRSFSGHTRTLTHIDVKEKTILIFD
jgi:hypothetical protein